ncbi:peroxiredoxin [Oceaniglobus ichthyenteri]|uniref:peroxiredoxin n=1 Tax=Oceaniglobus ichthyenteri TaxID=2136177 RepID=UPI000D34DC02|nr:peroxiredoxin [Oceaniglobus ichthyenteri]
MAISVGDKLPNATLLKLGADGPETVDLHGLIGDRKVVIFALPGAFTGTCTNAHVPSFMRAREDLTKKGVTDVICISVNDPFVMQAWSDSTGAGDAGITMLGDPEGEFTKAMGREFNAPPAGLIARSKRYAMMVEGGEVKIIHEEESPGTCDVSGGEAMVAAL